MTQASLPPFRFSGINNEDGNQHFDKKNDCPLRHLGRESEAKIPDANQVDAFPSISPVASIDRSAFCRCALQQITIP
jgi:hypothetical protein